MPDKCELQSHCNTGFSPATFNPVKLASHINSYEDLKKDWNTLFSDTKVYHEQNKQNC